MPGTARPSQLRRRRTRSARTSATPTGSTEADPWQESIPATATFDQAAAAWSATAQSAEDVTATAAFAQAAAQWAASALVAQAVTADGAWTQAPATWAAVGIGGPDPIVFTPSSGRVWPAEREFIDSAAAFGQAAATWSAVMDVNNDEPLLLSDILELVA